MKKLILASFVFCLLGTMATEALALRWPTNLGRRVETMGGATLAIEDKTTAVSTVNHQNGAGSLFEDQKITLNSEQAHLTNQP